jgi:hypothetical protein
MNAEKNNYYKFDPTKFAIHKKLPNRSKNMLGPRSLLEITHPNTPFQKDTSLNVIGRTIQRTLTPMPKKTSTK